MKLRPYQKDAVDAARTAFLKHKKIVIVAPTASGKSLMIAEICRGASSKGKRILVVCHQGEILSQNENILNAVAPEISTGIFCAGQGRKDVTEQVIFASRQSLSNNPEACGTDFELVVVDEAHMVNEKEGTEYQLIFKIIKPEYIAGFTGTPWRPKGNIWGKSGYFDAVAYNISLDFLVSEGFLSEYVFGDSKNIIKTDALVIANGTKDFKISDLDEISTPEDVVRECIDQWESYPSKKRCSIFFCCSIKHSVVVAGELEYRDYKVGRLDGKMKRADRKLFMIDAKNGVYDCLVNVGTMTTGVDIPIIDTVVMLRATASPSLFVQCIGRGLRLFENKIECTILDFTDNITRFNSIDSPLILEKKEVAFIDGDDEDEDDEEKGGEYKGPLKYCPDCLKGMHPAVKVCPFCGYMFITHTDSMAKMQTSGFFKVNSFYYRASVTKAGENCYIANYTLVKPKKTIREWLMCDRESYGGQKARARLEEIRGLSVNDIEMIYIKDITADFPKVDSIILRDRSSELYA